MSALCFTRNWRPASEKSAVFYFLQLLNVMVEEHKYKKNNLRNISK